MTTTEDYSIALGCVWFADLVERGMLDVDELRTEVNQEKCVNTIAIGEEHGIRLDFKIAFETLIGCIDQELGDWDESVALAQEYAEIAG